MADKVTHKGGCHCGTVTFEFDGPSDLKAVTCTCSMCARTGFIHYFATQDEFRITSGADNLTEYTFNTRTAKHLFCKTCGVKSFYVPRSHPDGWSINTNCIDMATVTSLDIGEFDGANWEANIESLKAED
ncbi:GFA family protein [Kordiimonas gwangyangensis]|uniref:GFA family protein n=1 Tax=Kordiimonas gwangyangensis TaxID=288022 RepID=UPI00036AF6E8|nr:GFA family protein [Kordiimonas gwangyangensis]